MGSKQRRTKHNKSFKQMDMARRRQEDGEVAGVTCPLSKIPYRSQAAANKKMVKLRNSVNYQERDAPLHTYQCPYCECWHVGHDTRNYRQREA